MLNYVSNSFNTPFYIIINSEYFFVFASLIINIKKTEYIYPIILYVRIQSKFNYDLL